MIEGKVAHVLNSRELVINKGADDGVQVGMAFAVLDPSGYNVKDPDSGQTLGSVYRTKITVRVVDVEPRMSIGRTYETMPEIGSPFGIPSIADALRYKPSRARTLRTDDALFSPITETESYVKTGDPVRQLAEEADGPEIGTPIRK